MIRRNITVTQYQMCRQLLKAEQHMGIFQMKPSACPSSAGLVQIRDLCHKVLHYQLGFMIHIFPSVLRLLIGHAVALNYLNLSSCRYLPRGMKKLYRGQEDIRQLLDKIE